MLIKVTSDNVVLLHPATIFEVSDNPNATLYLTGKCYDAEYHRLTADIFMSQICRDAKTALGSHSGIYSAIYHNKTENNILFFTDALGIHKLYYYMSDNFLLISDHTDEIVQASDVSFSTDYSAWSEFLAFSHILGSRTFFQEIKSCRPGCLLSLHTDCWRLEEIHSGLFTNVAENPEMDFSYAVDTAIQHLKSAIGKILTNNGKSRAICPLSGGYNSRCLAACLKNLEVNHVETYTSYLDDGNGVDEELAKEVAAYLQFSNTRFSPDKTYFETVFSDYLRDTNYESGMCIWDTFFKNIDYSNSILFDGYAGSQLLQTTFHTSINCKSKNSVPNFLDSFFDENLNKHLKSNMDKRHYSYLIYLAKKGMNNELQQWHYNIALYYLFNLASRNLAYRVTHINQFTDVFMPFTDYTFINFILSVPYVIKSNQNFYKEIINKLTDGLGDLPSTNDISKIIEKPIVFDGSTYKSLLLEELDDYWESIGGIYHVNFLKENIKLLEEKKYHLNYLALPFYVYKKWRKKYTSRLTSDSLETYFAVTLDACSFEKKSIIIPSSDEPHKIMNCWLEFIKRETESSSSQNILSRIFNRHTHKTKVLFTMDVEGFNYGPLYSHGIYDTTDSRKAVEQLIFGGKLANGHFVLEDLADDKNIPFTFFVETYTPLLDQEGLHRLLSVCSSAGNQAALHCHPFGLTQDFLKERELAPSDYQSKYGFSQILQYGVDTFKDIIHTHPTAFRSGNFQVYPGHFEVLHKMGFKIDSSLFHNSANNYTSAGQEIKNECRIINGIWEVPCTTFYDIASNRISRLDMNLAPFEKKLECIARNIVSGSKTITMLMHSWSFSDYYIQGGSYGKLSKLYHDGVSEQALDELRYLAEFIRMTEKAELITMDKLLESEKTIIHEPPLDLVDVCGRPEHLSVYKMPPSFGKLRNLPPEGFIDLKEGRLFSSDMSQLISTPGAHELDLMLPEKKQPHAGDFTEINYDIPVKPGKRYDIRMVLDCPYFKEKFQGRDSIRYAVLINDTEIYSNYITNSDRDEYIEYTLRTANNTIHISIRLDCLKDETPWGWGTCSKTKIKGIHIFPRHDFKEVQ